MKPAIYLALFLANFIQQPTGPTSIMSGGHSIFYAPQDDRSFYQEIDKNDWPGDALSERQFIAAVDHFRDAKACSHHWRWALIGPNIFLLKGTSYAVHRAFNAPEPNIHWSRGYWGGTNVETMSVDFAKSVVEKIATDDCKYAHKSDASPDGHSIFYGPTQDKEQPFKVMPWTGSITATGNIYVDKDFAGGVRVDSQTGRVERLTPAEYAGLQKLRQAVADEEMRIAKAHGVYIEPSHCIENPEDSAGPCTTYPGGLAKWASSDRYEFRGQFLLINVPDASAEGKAK